MGSQLDPLPLSRVGSRERATKSQLFATWLCETLKWVSPRDLGARHASPKVGLRQCRTLPKHPTSCLARCCESHTPPHCSSSHVQFAEPTSWPTSTRSRSSRIHTPTQIPIPGPMESTHLWKHISRRRWCKFFKMTFFRSKLVFSF